ncbi:Ldh family oxidoreductase [Acinetobacter baumannii]|nr:Ldh family oxidoreductase [Acinetobacter baumannii]
MSKKINLSLDEVHQLAFQVLTKYGMSAVHANSIADVITAGERDECFSHGIYRLLVLSHTLKQGCVSGDALPDVKESNNAIVEVDAKFAFSQLAFERGLLPLIEKAHRYGIAALKINNCFHFSALWPEVEKITEAGLVGIALTPSHAWVTPAGGSKPALGTNPIAFGWPRKNKYPYVFDFATSAIARGDIELHSRENIPLPENVAVDKSGKPTIDANAVFDGGSMLTFGGHKGSALSTMIELLAGPLIGDLTSLDSLNLDNGKGCTPCHGELILAFDPKIFGLNDLASNDERAERLFSSITEQGARLPSQRRYKARERSLSKGVFISQDLYKDILDLLK